MKLINSEAPVNRSEYVENVIKNAGKTKHYFLDQEIIRGKKVSIIEVYSITNVTQTPTGNALLNATAFKEGFLVIVSKGNEAINRIPLIALDPIGNYGRRLLLDHIEIDWVKSFIEFPRTDNLVVNEAIFLNVLFNDK